MAVHAHPDDEATSTGGVLARYASQGIRTVLVTCTDGRCGDGPGGVKPGEPGHDPDAVVALRRQELEASCAVLKVSDVELLGYGDSGMMGWATNDAPGAFWRTPVAEAAARLAALIEQYEPDVVVTYDENGFYGHPDHIQAHRVAMAALERSGSDAKVYWTTVPHSDLQRIEDYIREEGIETGDDDDGPPPPGLPDEQVSAWVDCTAFADQKYDALAAHGSQSDNIFFLEMGRERFAEFMGVETFVRVDGGVDRTRMGEREDDLFAGRED